MTRHGKAPIYPVVPVKRECSCSTPAAYKDEDGDRVCFRCGRLVKGEAKAA